MKITLDIIIMMQFRLVFDGEYAACDGRRNVLMGTTLRGIKHAETKPNETRKG